MSIEPDDIDRTSHSAQLGTAQARIMNLEMEIAGLRRRLENENIACEDIAREYADCGGELIAKKIADRRAKP